MNGSKKKGKGQKKGVPNFWYPFFWPRVKRNRFRVKKKSRVKKKGSRVKKKASPKIKVITPIIPNPHISTPIKPNKTIPSKALHLDASTWYLPLQHFLGIAGILQEAQSHRDLAKLGLGFLHLQTVRTPGWLFLGKEVFKKEILFTLLLVSGKKN